MRRTTFALTTFLFAAACMDNAASPVGDNISKPIPNPITLVGDAGPGAIALAELQKDGLPVTATFEGRAAGITTFCTGNATELVMATGQDLTPEERTRCRTLKNGWGWSALSIAKGPIFYVRYEFALDILEQAPITFD